MIDASAIYIIWLRDLKINWRDRGNLIGALVRSILWLVVLGLGLRAGFKSVGGATFSQYIFPGIITMTILFAAVQSAISIVWEREFGFLRELLVAPIPRTSITIGKTLSGATWAMIQGIVVLAFAPIVGVSMTPVSIIKSLLIMLLIAVSLSSIGIIIASRIKSFQGFGVIVNLIIMPMFFLSSAIFPLPWLPDWLKTIIMLNPLTYAIDLLRAATISLYDFSLYIDLTVTISFGIILIILANVLFIKEI